MKKGYLYLIFIALGSVVVLSIALIFKLSAKESLKTAPSNRVDTLGTMDTLVGVETYEDSWVQKILKEKKHKEYLYPTEKYYIEFN